MVDGPGIRSVIFFSGCPLRCLYCHNPDTWEKASGDQLTVEYIMEEVRKYKSYQKASGGGVTISGGEPFMQPQFLIEVLKACRQNGIHTIIDTSGYAHEDIAREALKYTDLLMLDIKAFDPKTYKKLTGVAIDRTLRMLEIAQEMNVLTRVRYVLVPGVTDNMDEIRELAKHLKNFTNLEKVVVLPFHKTGEFKWKERNIPYELGDTQPPSAELLKEAQGILEM